MSEERLHLEVDMSGDLHLLQHLLPLLSSERCSRLEASHGPTIQRIIRKHVGTAQQDIRSAKGKEMSVREKSMAQFIPPKPKSSLRASKDHPAAFHSGFVIVRLPLVKRTNSVTTHTKLEITNTVFTKDDGTCFQWRVSACLFQGKNAL